MEPKVNWTMSSSQNSPPMVGSVPQSKMDDQLVRSKNAIGMLGELILHLKGRLEPVMRVAGPQGRPPLAEAKKDELDSPLVKCIGISNEQLRIISAEVEDILSRLEI